MRSREWKIGGRRTSEKKFDFERLEVYQRAVSFTDNLYMMTRSFPRHEQFGITSQLRRAALSIPLNIAEGAERYHNNERRQFYRTARSSVHECVPLLEISKRQRYLSEAQAVDYYEECHELAKMISGLIKSLKTPD